MLQELKSEKEIIIEVDKRNEDNEVFELCKKIYLFRNTEMIGSKLLNYIYKYTHLDTN